MRLARQVRASRGRRGLTQAAVARKIGVSEAYVSMIESGAQREPSLVTLQKLGKALGMHVAKLVG